MNTINYLGILVVRYDHTLASRIHLTIFVTGDQGCHMEGGPRNCKAMEELMRVPPYIERTRTQPLWETTHEETDTYNQRQSFCKVPMRTYLLTGRIPTKQANAMEDR